MNFLKITSYPAIAILCAMADVPQTSVNILAILVLIDIMTGVTKQYVVDPTKLTSKTGIIGILSKFFVIFIPILIGIVVKEVGIDFGAIISGLYGVLIVYEVYSILGNFLIIRKGDPTLLEYDAISIIIKKMQDTMKSVIEKFFT